MDIIDSHAIISTTPDHVLELMTEMNRLNITKACISGMGSMFDSVTGVYGSNNRRDTPLPMFGLNGTS